MPDGGYWPRTVFTRSDGTVDLRIHGSRTQYKYLLTGEAGFGDASNLIATMERARRMLR